MKSKVQACVFGLLMIAVCSRSSRASSPLPDRRCQGVQATGQTIAYGPGDDGMYEKGFVANGPRFTDNLNGTVKDNLTGLIWLKYANCFGEVDWADGLSMSNSLASGSCGLTDSSVAGDWRLPNLRELHSLFDYTQHSPALPSGHPFSGVQLDSSTGSALYWSSTTFTSGVSAWIVLPRHGGHTATGKIGIHFVWPVRDGQ